MADNKICLILDEYRSILRLLARILEFSKLGSETKYLDIKCSAVCYVSMKNSPQKNLRFMSKIIMHN